MDDIAPEYDAVVIGTGLTECVLSGLLSVQGKKVLQIDRNGYYGGDSATVGLETLFRKYRSEAEIQNKPWEKYGRPSEWFIDLVPKFLMANGELTSILVATKVTNYVGFKQIAGSYVQQGQKQKATLAKVPSNASEALSSPLMGLFEKRRAKKFLEWVGNFNEDDPATHNGMNLERVTMKEVYDKFGLEATTRDFVGHSMALYSTDDYIKKEGGAKDAVERIRLYVNSMAKFGSSPYIYPEYGIGDLPQGFARLSAIHGGTFMLKTHVNKINYENGKASGIEATMEGGGDNNTDLTFSTKTKKIFADPGYFKPPRPMSEKEKAEGVPERTNSFGVKVKEVGKVAKAFCILDHAIPGTHESDSLQLIIPQSQIGRTNDIYIACVSGIQSCAPTKIENNTVKPKYWIAIVSTMASHIRTVEEELQPGFERLGSIAEKFVLPELETLYEPLESGTKDQIFISKSYDATSHFETTTDDIRDIYRRAEGEELKVEPKQVETVE